MQSPLHQILKKYWGYDSFRPLQLEIISSLVKGKNTFALLPTGGGKSLCYQLPALYFKEGCTLVVSPLIALMKDQVDDLKSKGIKAEAIYSGLANNEIERIFDNASNGYVKLLYVSPERLQNEWFLQRLPNIPLNFIAVDEAHCISQWGYDFRPAYLQIAEIKKLKPNLPFIALTATATPLVKDDIIEKLGLQNVNFFSKSFYRSNLHYQINETDNKIGVLINNIKQCKGSSIIYVRSRKRAEQLSKVIHQNGLQADYYHAGLNKETRTEKQNNWIEKQNACIVCTSAFGMGIDKPNVRLVFHYDLTESLEAYMQESGRAGRDGLPSKCILAYNIGDIEKLKYNFESSFPKNDFIRKVYKNLGSYLKIAVGSKADEPVNFDLFNFCNTFQLNVNLTYHALKLLEKLDYINLSNDFSKTETIRFRVGSLEVINFKRKASKFQPIIDALLRECPGIMEGFVNVYPRKLAVSLGINVNEVKKQLSKLTEMQIIDYQSKNGEEQIILTTEYLSVDNLFLNQKSILQLKEAKQKLINSVIGYLQNTDCRQKYMLAYFGETDFEACGKCDICLQNQFESTHESFEAFLLDLVALNSQSIEYILSKTPLPNEEAIHNIRMLASEGKIKIQGDIISK